MAGSKASKHTGSNLVLGLQSPPYFSIPHGYNGRAKYSRISRQKPSDIHSTSLMSHASECFAVILGISISCV
jgi:hypothetical protein